MSYTVRIHVHHMIHQRRTFYKHPFKQKETRCKLKVNLKNTIQMKIMYCLEKKLQSCKKNGIVI